MLATVGCATEWCGGRRHGSDSLLAGVSIDSRRVMQGDLFVALPGENVDGHDFVAAAARSGAAAAMVTSPLPLSLAQIVVDDCTSALMAIAGGWRRLFAGKVTAITGSNGKTTVKEMLAAICRAAVGDSHIHHSAGNMNNALGASLSILALRPHHRYAVLETGMDAAGELLQLGAMCRPHVALINNAQRAHLGNFNSVSEIAEAKGELLNGLSADGIAVLNADDAHFPLWQQRAKKHRLLTFGFGEGAQFVGQFSEEGLRLPGCKKPLHLKVAGEHNARNALAAAAAAHALNLPIAAVVQGLESFTGVSGRLQCKNGYGGALLLDDSYNANPDSLTAALDVLAQCAGKKIAVLGDMLALGESTLLEHQNAAAAVTKMGAQLLTVGDNFAKTRAQSKITADAFQHFSDKQSLILFLQKQMQDGEKYTVLIKGSRGMYMEEVVQKLSASTDEDADLHQPTKKHQQKSQKKTSEGAS